MDRGSRIGGKYINFITIILVINIIILVINIIIYFSHRHTKEKGNSFVMSSSKYFSEKLLADLTFFPLLHSLPEFRIL